MIIYIIGLTLQKKPSYTFGVKLNEGTHYGNK